MTTSPFCWQSISSLEHLRTNWSSTKARAHTGLAVYVALTALANEARARKQIGANSEAFECTRAQIGTKACVDKRSVDAAMPELERLGMVRVERRRAGKLNLPSSYRLLEVAQAGSDHSSRPSEECSPPPARGSDHSSLGVAETDPQGGGDRSPGVANTGRGTAVEEVPQERKEGEEDPPTPLSGEGSDLSPQAAPWLVDSEEDRRRVADQRIRNERIRIDDTIAGLESDLAAGIGNEDVIRRALDGLRAEQADLEGQRDPEPVA